MRIIQSNWLAPLWLDQGPKSIAACKNAGTTKVTNIQHIIGKWVIPSEASHWWSWSQLDKPFLTVEIDAWDSVASSSGPLTGPLLKYPNSLIHCWNRCLKMMMMRCKLYLLICDEHGQQRGGPLATQFGKAVWCSTREWLRGSINTGDMHCRCIRRYHCSIAHPVRCEMMKNPLFPCVTVCASSPTSQLYTFSLHFTCGCVLLFPPFEKSQHMVPGVAIPGTPTITQYKPKLAI